MIFRPVKRLAGQRARRFVDWDPTDAGSLSSGAWEDIKGVNNRVFPLVACYGFLL